MQSRPRRPQFAARPEASSAHVTSAIGMEETFGRSRARRTSLFTRTLLWITGLVCIAFLLATFAQAWSNDHFIAQVHKEQQNLEQVQAKHTQLQHAAQHYQDPAVVESEAREELGYIRPGEQPVVIMNGDQPQPARASSSTPASSHAGYWNDWWRLFFGISN
ncbi:FtsB family cell division protein [Dictyobacter arantiisoli]|uniref:Septum formation initiator n=1 Tax=Dictyobacter arantiisoli TaxID=2014874 RepID=A0A5A5T581_9CHLR|nr:septum formation initiator family protein [Dictyobacter arantiisoli]GCF06520.1 hypothetical protein KDI_00840 [Dictyobacter arantiisoli]